MTKPKIIDYKVLREDSLAYLEDKVNKHLKEGWRILPTNLVIFTEKDDGCTTIYYHREMVKLDEDL